MPLIRFLGSFVLAAIFVLGMLIVGLKLYGAFDDERPRRSYQRIDLLSEFERRRLKELLGEPERVLPVAPRREEIPRFELPARQISGFVELEVEVGPDGRVESVRVLDAMPAGYYEQQARSLMESRRFPPTGGRERRVEVIEFEIAAGRGERAPTD